MRGFRHWNWHLDEVYVTINSETHYLWRAVDQEGDVLESYVTRTALAMAKTLANGPTEAFANTRALLAVGPTNPLHVQLDEESRCITGAAGRAEGQIGISAFIAKQKPRFRPD